MRTEFFASGERHGVAGPRRPDAILGAKEAGRDRLPVLRHWANFCRASGAC
jgi:hypothetical protein